MDVPPRLRGFAQHGVIFTGTSGETQAVGICPFCGKANKFLVNVESMLWDCKRCGRSGNFDMFLSLISRKYAASLIEGPITVLSEDRGLRPQTFRAWGVGWSGSFYSIPARGNEKGITTDIHRYIIPSAGLKKKRTLSTSGSHLSFFVPERLRSTRVIWVAEGEWDGMAIWECLRRMKRHDDVCASPGAGNFPNKLIEGFYGRDIIVIPDNDEAGIRGAHRINRLLAGAVQQIRFLHWPPGYPEKFDFRDLYLQTGKNPATTLKFVDERLRETPPQLIGDGTTPTATGAAGVSAPPNPTGEGVPPDVVISQYRKWLHISNPEILDVLFGSIFANRISADPLWIFLVAPPGGSKSELIMSLNDAPLIYITTSITPKTLISGANFAGGGDPSLIPKLDGKVLAIKDFTTILSMDVTSRDTILGQFRDAYDGETSRDFGNGIVRRYKSTFGVLAGVTPIIERWAGVSGVLGERFIKYRIKQAARISGGAAVIDKALENITKESKMRTSLRATAKAVLDRPVSDENVPTIPIEMRDRIRRLAQWIAGLRGVVDRERYTGLVTFKPMHEIGTRLAKQFATLALGIGIWKWESEISMSTYETIVQVACDTAPDRVEEVVKQMYLRGRDDYVTAKEVSEWTRFPEATTRHILQDLNLLRVIKKQPDVRRGSWHLSESVLSLMDYLHLYKSESHWINNIGRVRRARRVKKL